MAERRRSQSMALQVRMAGAQWTATEARRYDPAPGESMPMDASVAIQIGDVELHVTNQAALFGLGGWWDDAARLAQHLPIDVGPDQMPPMPTGTGEIAVRIDQAATAGATSGLIETGNGPVLRGVIGRLQLDVQDRYAFRSIAAGLVSGLEASREALRTPPAPVRAKQHIVDAARRHGMSPTRRRNGPARGR